MDSRRSPGPNHPSVERLEDIFSNQVTWLLDGTAAHRLRARQTTSDEDEFMVVPINSAFGILNPRTGELFLKVVHSSEWIKLTRMAQVAELPLEQVAPLKVADDTAGLVRMLTVERRPKQIFAHDKWMLSPLEEKLRDFPNVIVRGSKFQLPSLAFLNVDKLVYLIDQTTESQSQRFFRINIYDDWLATISSDKAFWRLNLILRGYHANRYKAKSLLNPSQRTVTEPDRLWPSLRDDQWMDVEYGLSNLILSEYAKMHDKVNVSSLTQHERRDILLGVETRQEGQEESDIESIVVIDMPPEIDARSSRHNKRRRFS